ncbi:hypothetical protein P8625_02925 [Tenacibaculum tangerinum]|uniref:Uncharacterized protein n=1 Tax=Tenacibaculum tangerinum TaxID=3038772 RepID=A0ABY8L3Y0_9FLAO|nr:hypothetical protein [Tenacibaculum tangerinum]WGH76137.1 hypothetical protein P8625_02925 [Tenacibaculum tangerinum]
MKKILSKFLNVGSYLKGFGSNVDKAIEYGDSGYKSILLYKSFFKHLKAFRADWIEIYGEEKAQNKEQKTK